MCKNSLPADASLQTLRQRSQLLAFVRDHFTAQGYWEVETPLASHETCIDLWLDPIPVQVAGQSCYLQTSPEFAMKRLMCQGADAIFQICKAFRDGEQGDSHNPEFTMLEWYHNRKSLADQMTFVESLVTRTLSFAVKQGWIPQSPVNAAFESLTYEQAFQRFAGLSAFHASHTELVETARSVGGHVTDTTERDDLLNLLLATCVEPRLAELGAVFLKDFPASQAALARVRQEETPVAERFELYLNGSEICNGYQELTDPDELRRRMQTQNMKRQQHGKSTFEIESHLARDMDSGFPECSGVALGFDRLVMFCLGCDSIRDVIAFPFDIA